MACGFCSRRCGCRTGCVGVIVGEEFARVDGNAELDASVQVFPLSSLQIFSEDELDYLLCGRRELWAVRLCAQSHCRVMVLVVE